MVRALRWFLSHWMSGLMALALVAVDVFDSFGLDRAADEQASPLIATIAAPFYGGAERVGQKAITVVLIDDVSLQELGWDAQPSYGDQADLISAIASFAPAAVFLDYYYTFPHGDNPQRDIANFAQRLTDEAEITGVPIRIGPVVDEPIFAPLREVPAVGVAWRGLDLLTFPFHDEQGREMAPYALYRIWCARNAEHCDINWRPAEDTALTLSWGFGASPQALEFAAAEDARCGLGNPSAIGRLGTGLSHFFRAAFRAALYQPNAASGDSSDPLESRCFYADTVIASHVMSGAIDAQLAPMLRDRIVLVGASHARSADRHRIPQVGVVPGVYIHAMALDNLITQGPRHVRQSPTIVYALDAADLIELALTAFILVMAINFRAAAKGDPARWRSPRLPLTIVVGGVALIGGAVVSMTLLHWPPLNVLGVAALLSSLEFVFDSHARRANANLSKES